MNSYFNSPFNSNHFNFFRKEEKRRYQRPNQDSQKITAIKLCIFIVCLSVSVNIISALSCMYTHLQSSTFNISTDDGQHTFLMILRLLAITNYY